MRKSGAAMFIVMGCRGIRGQGRGLGTITQLMVGQLPTWKLLAMEVHWSLQVGVCCQSDVHQLGSV